MQYLVTGGAGFIGSHLVDALLADGHHVTVLDDLSTGKRENLPASDALSFLHGDCADAELLATTIPQMDGVFHLAAISSVQKSQEDWLACHRINLGATVHILEQISRLAKPIPMLYASSAAVFGNPMPEQLPLNESAPLAPESAYGADKAACEMQARAAQTGRGIPTLGLRFFNVYGPRQDPKSPYSGVISIFSDKLSNGLPLTIFGDGEQTRDFIYVSDIVSCLTFSMKALKIGTMLPPILHCCTGTATTITELAHLIASQLSHKAVITYAESREGDIRSSVGDNSLLVTSLNLPKMTTITEGLTRLLTTKEK